MCQRVSVLRPTAADTFYGFGIYAFELVSGYDCPSYATSNHVGMVVRTAS